MNTEDEPIMGWGEFAEIQRKLIQDQQECIHRLERLLNEAANERDRLRASINKLP